MVEMALSIWVMALVAATVVLKSFERSEVWRAHWYRRVWPWSRYINLQLVDCQYLFPFVSIQFLVR
jgi:hypothetical protein